MPAPVHYTGQHTGQQVASHWRRLCGWISSGIFGFLGTTVLVSLCINILSTWFTSPKGIIPADSPLVRLLTQWPLLLLVCCFLFVIAILARFFSRDPTQSATTLLTTQNRAFMLQRLRYSYRALIDTSLQGAARIELGLANKPDAVQNTSTFLLRSLNKPERMLSPGSSILDVYEQAAHELLILGKAGAGKSTLLYQLGLHLVEQAERDEMSPLPILLPLSSWAVKRLPLQEWMIEQLSSPLYEIPRQVSQQWVQHQQILPLLDGLDEMETSARSACITAINVYHREHLHPLVVCSRSEEYATAAHKRLALQNAVIVQPLTNQQIDNVLIQGDKLLVALRSELKRNSELHNLVRSPLLLNILLLTYQGTGVHSLPKKRTTLQKQIFTAYIDRMMQYKGNAERYPHAQTITWLCWLAGQMRRQNQTIFYLELLQPDWLSTKSRPFYRWSIALILPLFIMLFSIAYWTLLAILFSWLLRGRVEVSLEGVLGTIPAGLGAGLVFGLFLGQRPIRAAEFLTWSWKDIWFRLLVGFAFGLTGGGAFMLLRRLITRISGQQLTERLHLTPNEGIRRSAKNGTIVGLLVGPAFGFVEGLCLVLIQSLPTEQISRLNLTFGLFQGLYIALFVGLLVGLYFGLCAFIQHYVLRFWLWRTNTFPWKAVPFLEDATTRILLRRVGGGYSFAHRLLLDHFADLGTGSSQATAQTKATIGKDKNF